MVHSYSQFRGYGYERGIDLTVTQNREIVKGNEADVRRGQMRRLVLFALPRLKLL